MTPSTTNNTAAVARQRPTLRDHLKSDAFKAELAEVMPKHLTPERFVAVALACLIKTPKLANCTQESLFAAFRQLSSLGLEPDGRRAHLIPYGDICQVIIDYKGLAELILRSGEVEKFHADVVCENDIFDYNLGEIVCHRIDFRANGGKRGKPYAVYAFAKMKSGAMKCEVLSVDEVESVRSRSKSRSNGPWVTDWNEMAKKTAFRRMSKWLPLSPDLREKIESDDDVLDVVAESSRIPADKPNSRMLFGERMEQISQPVSKPSDDDVPWDTQGQSSPQTTLGRDSGSSGDESGNSYQTPADTSAPAEVIPASIQPTERAPGSTPARSSPESFALDNAQSAAAVATSVTADPSKKTTATKAAPATNLERLRGKMKEGGIAEEKLLAFIVGSLEWKELAGLTLAAIFSNDPKKISSLLAGWDGIVGDIKTYTPEPAAQ